MLVFSSCPGLRGLPWQTASGSVTETADDSSSPRARGCKSKSKVSVGLVSSEASLPGLRTAVSSLASHVVLLCAPAPLVSVSKFPLLLRKVGLTKFNFITSLKAPSPNTVTS